MRKICALTTLVVAAASSHAVNVLANPGFESGVMSPWVQLQDFGGAEHWNVQSSVAHSGTFAATAVGNKLIFQGFSAVDTNMVTEVSFWVRNMDSGALINAFHFAYSDNTVSEVVFSESSTDWEFKDITAQLAPNKFLVGFGIWGFSGGSASEDRTYLDDVMINAVPEPASLVVLASAVALLGRRRRK